MAPSQKYKRFYWFSAAAGLLVALASVGLAACSTPALAQTKTVVFLAGPKDHGFPGRHEYEKDQRVLTHALENASNLDGITTKVYPAKTQLQLPVVAA